ncbi:uncharacterized protein LOC124131963 isoform X2 [Haliotis rufescens]|uniref:uncharacterized protein LOC124131963 isoform X2 n=1 Tax=Haliotis rufescens TaxID=6454 RepID=UPI00201F3A27|nr:uncharacterized protein LOC124131963 isoform X2 [Haliotis rufescens]
MAQQFLHLLLSTLLYGESPTGRNGGGDLSHHWSYKGEAGPANWSLLYPTCSGTRQSPVNIQDRNIIYQELPPFRFNNFDGSRTAFRLTNNGHTASISIFGNMSVEGGGLDGQYNTAELHFHWGSSNNLGSEHSINGRKYPLEMHIVSYATKYGSLSNAMRFRDGLAVLGTFFDVTRENPYFRPIEDGLIRAKYAGNYTDLLSVNLLGLIPADTSRYYRYYGSLTTPPCHQSVMWTLFEDVQYISPYQIHMLRRLYESHHDSHDHGGHGGHAEGRRQGGHGFASNHNTPMKALPLEEFLMDNYRPTQPHFDRVINCNILRYADPQYIQQSRLQLDSQPRQNDFITQRLSQINVDALFNKTLQRWLQSKGLSPNALTPEQLGMHAQGQSPGAAHFPQQGSFNVGHPDPVQGNGGNTGPGRGIPHTSHQGHSNGINQGQVFGNTQGGTSQTGAGAARPPDQLDLQVIQTQRIGPNGEQLTEIQVQLDPNGPNGAMTQEELQQLLGDPAIMDQIRQIVSSQTGGNGQVHEIIVAAPATANQGFAQSQFQDPQAFGGAGASPQGSTMQGAPQTLQYASGQNEAHVLEFHPSVPQFLIDELLRYPQWSLHYNETLIEINDLMRDLAAASVTTVPPPRQNQMNQFQPAQPLPVQGVQPGLLQGQGVQVGHLEGVNMNLQGVHVDQVGMGHGHTHGVGHSHGQGHGGMGQGQGTFDQGHRRIDQGHRSMRHSQGHVGQSHGNIGQGIGDIGQGNMGQGHMQSVQFGQSQNIGQQGLGNNFGQPGSQFDQHQTGGTFIQRAPTFQVDPFSAINGNIQVDPIQSVHIGQQTGNMGRVDLSRSGGTQRFQNVGANTGQADLQIISAREMKFPPWK